MSKILSQVVTEKVFFVPIRCARRLPIETRNSVSIGQLMVLVVYAAIGLSAFQTAGQSVYSKTKTELFYMLTLGLLIVATLTSLFRENPLGVPYRPAFPQVFGLAVLLKDYVSPNTTAPNMFRWHVVQSTLTIATAAVGSWIVNLLPLDLTPASLGKGTSPVDPVDPTGPT